MSGRDKKKRGIFPPGVKGWEEAGGEFYQESYPGAEHDLEVMQNDPHRISTLLPSKKNRIGTMKKDQKLTTMRHRTNAKNYQTTNALNNDVQISLLPDLSENLSNEKLLWEEIMKIKGMPVNMAQKKELKTKLLSRDTLRLQGFKQFKWKKTQSIMQMWVHLKEINKKLTWWSKSLKKIEGYYGTGVVSFFLFVKWLIFLNIVISLIMIVFVILPTIYDKINSNKVEDISYFFTFNETSQMINSLNAFFSPDSMTKSPLYYAYYENFMLNLGYFQFNLRLAYLIATFMYFLYSLMSVLKSAACGVKHSLLESQGQVYIYCNIIFAGWDFCIQNEQSARIKHKALHNEIIGRLYVEKKKEEKRNRTKQEWCKLTLLRVIVNFVIITLLAAAGLVIFLAFEFSSTPNMEKSEWFVKISVEFMTAGCIIFFNLVLPYIFQWFVKVEKFSPISTIQITLFRNIMLRYFSLCVLLWSVKKKIDRNMLKPEEDMHSWESYLARELYKLLILNVITQIINTFFLNLPRSLLAKYCRNKCIQYIGKQEFSLSSNVLDIVYMQSIIWLGSFYAPLLPVVGVIILLVIFYVKKFACLVNCGPSSDIYYASRSYSLYMFILLVSFLFSVIPWAYSVATIKPSSYGPFVGYDTVWKVFMETISNLPHWVNEITSFCVSSVCLVPLFILLILTNYYFYAVYVVNKKMVLVLKRQLILEGHDKQFLLNRLSAFIKQQQERYRPRNVES